MMLLAKLLLAHLLGDFLLQPDSWVADKEKRKHLSPYLYLHAALHGILAFLLVAEWSFAPFALLLAVIHGCIDYTKLRYQTPDTKRLWFIADQLLHLASLAAISLYIKGFLYFNPPSDAFWLVFTGLVFLGKPASIIIKTLISVWVPSQTPDTESLQNAGNYIGMLERIFIYGFILTGHFDAVGFLLGAKSIFRFGDLTGSKDRKLTEYVLIGTLLSFGLAMLTALIVQATLSDFL